VAGFKQGADYWRYVRLAIARIRARGVLAGSFAVLAFAATVWVVWDEPGKPGSWGGLFSLLSVIFAALAVIRLSMKPSLDENYSLAYALAHGYVSNFARDAIADLLKQSPGGRFIVFRPQGLEELGDAAVTAYKQRIAERGYTASIRHLESGRRVRDVLMLEARQAQEGVLRYVDFPTTLLTLKSLVDYRSAERERQSGLPFSGDEQRLITQELIDKFFDELVKLLATDVAQGHVIFTDSQMGHL
jgi:hypothetical protein